MTYFMYFSFINVIISKLRNESCPSVLPTLKLPATHLYRNSLRTGLPVEKNYSPDTLFYWRQSKASRRFGKVHTFIVRRTPPYVYCITLGETTNNNVD